MYVENSRVSIALSARVSYYPREVWTLLVHEADVDGDRVREELAKVATLDGQLQYPVSNSVTVSERQTNWGASGSFGDYMIELSEQLLEKGGVAAFGVVVKVAFERILKRAGDGSPRTPLNLVQATDLIRASIARVYSEPADSLVVLSSTYAEETGVYEFALQGPSGHEYGATAGEVSGLPTCMRIWLKGDENRPRH